MRRTRRSRSRTAAATLSPMLAMLVAAHMINPFLGLAAGAREHVDKLMLVPVICGGFGLICAQATLLGLWANFASDRLTSRLAPTVLLLSLVALAPAVLHGSFVTSRYVLLPFVGVLLLMPLRWLGLRIRRRVQPGREPRGPKAFPLLQLQLLMLGVAILLVINGPAFFTVGHGLSKFDYQVVGFAVGYTLLLTVVICIDPTRSFFNWLWQVLGLVGLAVLPGFEVLTFEPLSNFEPLWYKFLVPFHGAQCVVVVVSLLVIRAGGYRLERVPGWWNWRVTPVVAGLREVEDDLELLGAAATLSSGQWLTPKRPVVRAAARQAGGSQVGSSLAQTARRGQWPGTGVLPLDLCKRLPAGYAQRKRRERICASRRNAQRLLS